MLEVSIRADGSLGEALIRRSSGRKEIDQAALSILRLASPFDPFPEELRKQYDELRFAYEWQFLGRRPTGRRFVRAAVTDQLLTWLDGSRPLSAT